MKNFLLKKDKPKFTKKIAFIRSRFNSHITNALAEGALKAASEMKLKVHEDDIFEVAGAFEIPLLAKKICQTKKYAGIIAMGAVIRGETSHYDYVCQAVTQGLLRVQLDESLPIAFAILTTDNDEQAYARASQNEQNKGYEAFWVLMESLTQFNRLKRK